MNQNLFKLHNFTYIKDNIFIILGKKKFIILIA